MASLRKIPGSLVLFMLLISSVAEGMDPATQRIPDPDQFVGRDHPDRTSGLVPVVVDTMWFGGTGPDGLAESGGVWDFEDGTLQGWFGVDQTEMPDYVRRITRGDAGIHGDPVDPVINGGASLWFGAHQDEAAAMCWPGGQGYGNSWRQLARRTFLYDGAGEVTVAFDYFVDSETDFDFTYVYVEVDGIRSLALNTCANPDDDGVGYSGSADLWPDEAIGSPEAPAHEVLTITDADLPTGPGPFDVLFYFDSDPLFSDALDLSGSFLNSQSGPFGVDDIHVTGDGALDEWSDFETGMDGWAAGALPGIGDLVKVARLADLDPITDPCTCPLTVGDNEWVLIASIIDGSDFPHPDQQRNLAVSPVIPLVDVPPDQREDVVVRWDVWADLPSAAGVGYRAAVQYYPWTCPDGGGVGWTPIPLHPTFTFFWGFEQRCTQFIASYRTILPEPVDVNSLRVVFDLIGACEDFGSPHCVGPTLSNQSPYWDDIRVGLVEESTAGVILDLLYQDAFPTMNSVFPSATTRIRSYYDTNRVDGDPTNAALGDSAVVLYGGEAEEVHLNFRVWPGPALNTDHPWFSEPRFSGEGPLAPGWASARMDTAETHSGAWEYEFATYFWPDGSENGDRILADDLFTPGTTIEYFFSVLDHEAPGELAVTPDTTGGFYLEVEVLPGFFTRDGSGYLSSTFLYVNAFYGDTREAIEDLGLRPRFGTLTDSFGKEQDLWDRYDYQGAGGNTCAPMAREAGGNNGMTRYQSLVYSWMLYNTGYFEQEGLRDGDARLLSHWVSTDDFDRWGYGRGLWLNGNGIAEILDNPSRPDNQALLTSIAGASIMAESYRDLTGDSSLCVRLSRYSEAAFPPNPADYAAIRGNGCPELYDFNVLQPAGDGASAGNLVFVDQSGSGAETGFASIAADRFDQPINHGVVIDAFSLDHLRLVPDGWTGTDCGDDRAALTIRVADVLDWMGTPEGSGILRDDVVVGLDDSTAPAIRRDRLVGNAPNPFNPRTTVRFELADKTHVTLRAFDVAGRQVRELLNEPRPAGAHTLVWDGRDDAGHELGSGVYWVRMETARGFKASTRLMLLR